MSRHVCRVHDREPTGPTYPVVDDYGGEVAMYFSEAEREAASEYDLFIRMKVIQYITRGWEHETWHEYGFPQDDERIQMAVNVAINEDSLFDVLVRQGHQRGIFGVTNAE